jgi:hypothetical protein
MTDSAETNLVDAGEIVVAAMSETGFSRMASIPGPSVP